MPPEIAPRWALCSDCRLENLPTCSDVVPCWHPMTIADLPENPNDQEPQVWVRPSHEDASKYRMYRRAAQARVEARPWMVQHYIENPTHTVQETLDEPARCLTCDAKSPAWYLPNTTIKIGPFDGTG